MSLHNYLSAICGHGFNAGTQYTIMISHLKAHGNRRTHHWSPSCSNLPSFLAKNGYKEPRDTKNTNYTDWCPGNLDFFGKCVADPAYQDSFSGFMRGWGSYKVPWPEFYDTNSLIDGADLSNGGALCVDIGGHHGIDLTRLLDKHPDIAAGSLILQDLPEVLIGVEGLNKKIKAMPHDMFQLQPVKGMILESVFLSDLDARANYGVRDSRESSILLPCSIS